MTTFETKRFRESPRKKVARVFTAAVGRRAHAVGTSGHQAPRRCHCARHTLRVGKSGVYFFRPGEELNRTAHSCIFSLPIRKHRSRAGQGQGRDFCLCLPRARNVALEAGSARARKSLLPLPVLPRDLTRLSISFSLRVTLNREFTEGEKHRDWFPLFARIKRV